MRNGKLSAHGKLFLFARDASTKKLCVSRSACADADFSIGSATSYSRARPRQALIFSGRIGDKVTLGYREFAGNAARPAMSNDVTYDLAASKVLSYRGARVEIVDATNTDLTYRIVAGFD